ncbi:unnamed protein product [Caenorhabditis auriculariae]|uniref:TOG domain-containing protein n=1 Tax=Caenorhabditis auriculariae TaxID=2777116 RepID=A0A8S1HZP3_9PELO|nr:unnamed protein product [Caenorhabditis auriculariae]
MVENQSEAEMKGPQVSTMDDEEAEEEPVMVAKLDFEKLFRMAEDPDMAELLRGPIDTAIHNLENGKEVQKLTAIRSFADLLDTEGDVCLKKLLPVIQAIMACIAEPSEKGKVVMKICNASPYHLNAAAWLETIVEVADLLSLASVKKFIVPVAQQQADPVQRVQRRIIATKLLNKLANILPPQDVRKDLTPCVQMLCKDANSNVRSAIAQRLFVIADSLKSPHDVVVSILPCFVQLLADEDSCVRESAMNNLNDCIPLLTKEAKKHSLFPLVKRSTEESLEKKNETLIIIARNIGRWSVLAFSLCEGRPVNWPPALFQARP